jgi:hypothetical protein
VGEKIIKEGGDSDQDRLLSELAKLDLTQAIEAQEAAQKAQEEQK